MIAPERMHRVQTFIRFTDEPTRTRTFCRFGIQRRLETLCAWLTRFPNTGALPQTSHIFAMLDSLKIRKAWIVITGPVSCKRMSRKHAKSNHLSKTGRVDTQN